MVKRIAAGTLLLLVVFVGLTLWKRHELFRRLASLPAYTHDDWEARDVEVPMRDGVRLHTELYLPVGLARAPTVLVRNPYSNLRILERLTCQALTRYGYACVLQDVRGQMDSEGEWSPIVNEHDDGLDTLAWLVKQPFVDGNVAMRGPSYLTCTQWAMADALPPEVKTLIPSVFGTDLRQVFFERGLFRPDILTAWATLMPRKGMRLGAGDDYLAAARFRPATGAAVKFMEGEVPWYRDTLGAVDPASPYWHTPAMEAFRAMPEHAQVPMLFIGAFFDPFFMAQLDTWQRLATRDQSAYFIGPWNHLGLISGDLEFAPHTPSRLDQWPLMLEWLDHHLKGRPLTTITPGTVSTWSAGDTAWQRHARWPEAPTLTTLQLTSAATAQSCEGGALQPEPAPAEEVQFTFDPANPVPTRGGAALLSFAFFRSLGITPGPVDQGDSCARDDVLTFRSAPRPTAQRLSGVAHLDLTVRSTAPDTAFVARLIAEQDGQALLVREDAATLAWPTAETQSAQAHAPGDEVHLRIDFWPMEWVLPAGGRWRVDVTSSSFPALAVHSNRAGPWEAQDGADVATQTLELGAGRAVLALPLTRASATAE